MSINQRDAIVPVSSGSQALLHIPALDGLRGAAILMVIAVHTQPVILTGGQDGVQLFFVLSGFLITRILYNEWNINNRVSISHFYIRRLLRLAPAMLLTLFFVLIYVYYFETAAQFTITYYDELSALFYVWNWRMLYLWSDITNHQWLIFHLWSLSVEEQYYLIWPVILLIALHSGRGPRLIIATLTLVILAVFVDRSLLYYYDHDYPVYFRTDARVDALSAGSITAFASVFYSGKMIYKQVLRSLIVPSIIYAMWDATQVVTNFHQVAYQFLTLSLCYSLIIGFIMEYQSNPISLLFSLKPIRWVGKISYGLYLYHWPILYLARNIKLNPVMVTLGAVLASILIAAGSFYFIEQPFLRLKSRFAPFATKRAIGGAGGSADAT